MYIFCLFIQIHFRFPIGFEYSNLLLVVTDAAPAMKSAMKSVCVIFPKMIHVTCLAHGLHRLAETVRYHFDNVNKLISSMKAVFLKSPARIRYFRETAVDIPLPPSPVVTRWGTWLQAACYYANYFESIEHVVEGLDEKGSECIAAVKQAFKDKNLFNDLVFIKANFEFLPIAIGEAEARGRPIDVVVDKIVEIRERLLKLRRKEFLTKWDSVIGKNVGFSSITKLSDIIQGKQVKDAEELKLKYTVVDIAAYKYAPLCSADVERIFSQYKCIYRDNRHNFTFDNLKKHCILKCNSSLESNELEENQ